jgi:hypothetical protein
MRTLRQFHSRLRIGLSGTGVILIWFCLSACRTADHGRRLDESGKSRTAGPHASVVATYVPTNVTQYVTNVEISALLVGAVAELSNAVVHARQEQAKAKQDIQNAVARVETAKGQQEQAEAAVQKAREEAKRLTDPEIKLRHAAMEAANRVKEARGNFLFDAVTQLRKRGMDIRAFEDGKKTNCFMAFVPDDKKWLFWPGDNKFVLGGPITNEQIRLEQHISQFNVLTNLIDRLQQQGFLDKSSRKPKQLKVSSFKILPADRFAAILSDSGEIRAARTLTILWPPDAIYAAPGEVEPK